MTYTAQQLAALVAENTVRAVSETVPELVRAELRVFLEDLSSTQTEWITAKECAARYGHSARWWRDRKQAFDAVQDGDGPKPRLFFSTTKIDRIRAQRPL